MRGEVRVSPTDGALAHVAVELICSTAKDAIDRRGSFSLVLSGGNTPKGVYELLATPEFSSQINWQKTLIFWGDERRVPPDHPDSNFHLANETLLSQVSLPPENIHRIKGELDPMAAAREYEDKLHKFFEKANFSAGQYEPRFDLILLGLGEDGHTASLFPRSSALQETRRWVMAQYIEKLGEWRITLTPVIINAARKVAFIIAGENKAEIFRKVFRGPKDVDKLPAQSVDTTEKELIWMVDQAAASKAMQ